MSVNFQADDPNLSPHHSPVTQQFLKKIALFHELPEESLNLFGQRVHKKKYKKGEQIISEFEEAQSIFFVKSGIVKLTKQDENGREMIVCIRREGELFAEACLFNDSTYYPATATMIQSGEIFYLNSQDMEQELMMSPELAVIIIRHMSKNLTYMTSMLRDLALLDVYTKTIRTLGRLVAQFEMNKCQQTNIEIPLTVQEFSHIIGASRESVSRVFSKLRKDGVLDIQGRQILIPEWCKFCASYLQGAQVE